VVSTRQSFEPCSADTGGQLPPNGLAASPVPFMPVDHRPARESNRARGGVTSLRVKIAASEGGKAGN
jgi:hypothetical protein